MNTPADQRVPTADQEALRHTARRAFWIGLWVWPSFTLLDVYMCFVVYPAAPFRWFLVGRVLGEIPFIVGYATSRRQTVNPRHLALLQDFSFLTAAIGIALMAIPLGGLVSSYMHGISIALLVRAVVVPEPWRKALPIFAAIGLAFPLVIGVHHLLVSPAGTGMGRDLLVGFGANYVFVVGSAVIGLLSGHLSWTARQQLYRARRLGRYRLQAPIGRGGMGEVWLAWDLSLKRNVALKLMRSGGAPDPESLLRFEREAQAASQLRIPHSVQVYDFGASDDGIHYIAMEYLSGLDLETMVNRYGPLPPDRVLWFARQICDSLDEAHAAGVIHRDVKPSNLFVTRIGANPDFLKLLDFGLARLRSVQGGEVYRSQAGMLHGTPVYMPPELWEGIEADERSDIYAVGVTLYFLLTGAVPYEGATPADVIRAQGMGDPALPSTRLGHLPAGLETAIMRCIAKRREARFQSVRELRTALDQVPGGWSIGDAEAWWRQARVDAPEESASA
jgi:serine/threonine-protein kinase